MRRIISMFAGLFLAGVMSAQTAGTRLPLSVVVEDFPQPFPANAKVQMATRLNQMLTLNGIASFGVNNDFVLTVITNPQDKIVLSGAPVQIMQNIDFVFYIVDANRQIVFSTYSASAQGVGQSEAKSYMDAIKRVNMKSTAVADFLEQGRRKIIGYYEAEAQNIFAQVRMLAQAHCYEEALYHLCGIPTETSCYQESLKLGTEIYKMYVDHQAQKNLAKAKALWAAEQNSAGAEAAGAYLAEILPEASCYQDAVKLSEEIKSKVREDWEWEMKKYQDGVNLEKQAIAAWQAIGVAYGNNQQPQTTNLAWLR